MRIVGSGISHRHDNKAKKVILLPPLFIIVHESGVTRKGAAPLDPIGQLDLRSSSNLTARISRWATRAGKSVKVKQGSRTGGAN
jgi:hypothetical protein